MNSPQKENTTAKSMKFFKSMGVKTIDGKEKQFYECNICGGHINGQNRGNLSSHLQHKHKEVYKTFNVVQKESIFFKRLKLLISLVEMISVNGRAFRSLLDSGFQAIIQSKLNKFKAAGCAINMNDNLTEVKDLMHEMANKVRMKIKEEVNGRILSLLIDIGTKNRRSIFGVSIQYRVNGILKVRSIGMIELCKSHTASFLADLIVKRLKVYDINLKQIITITTDNGANVLKMVRDVEAILKSAINADTCQLKPEATQSFNRSDNDDELTDEAIADLLAETEEEADDAALDELYDDILLTDHENLLSLVRTELNSEFGLNVLWDITGVNCAAHTLQLAVKSALKKTQQKHSNVIDLSRRVAKVLRSKAATNEMTETGENYKIPRLDVKTRWNSTYMMVKRLYLLEFF